MEDPDYFGETEKSLEFEPIKTEKNNFYYKRKALYTGRELPDHVYRKSKEEVKNDLIIEKFEKRKEKNIKILNEED